MKHIFTAFYCILLLFQFGNLSAQQQIPNKLEGFWQLELGQKVNLDGFYIGKNFIGIKSNLAMLDSIHQTENGYTLYLNNQNKEHFSLSIAIQASDSAEFLLSGSRKKLKCKRYDQNPNIHLIPVSEYSKIIIGKMCEVDNSREILTLKGGKLLYEGKYWNILWLGVNLQKSYDGLIEDRGEYQFINFSKQADNSITVKSVQKSKTYLALKAHLDKYAIMGNWYEPLKNEWTFGFFEKFVIYQGKFWNYKTLDIKKDKGIATLQNGNETLELGFYKANDSPLQISIGKQNAITYQKVGRTLPHYQTADTTHFADNHFAKIDTAYVTGYLRNWNSSKPFEISLHDMITDEQVSYYGDVDSLGRFEMKVPLYNSTMVFLDWIRMHQYGVIEPNEHYFLFYDGNSQQTLFMGETARINNEFAAFNILGIPLTGTQRGNNPQEMLSYKQDEFKRANNYVNSRLAQMQPFGEIALFFVELHKIRYRIGSYAISL